MSTVSKITNNTNTKVVKSTTKTDVKPLTLTDVEPEHHEEKHHEVTKKVRKVEKTIGGLNLEQYMRALLVRDPQIQLSAAFTTWDMIVEQIDNGDLKNTSRSNKGKKSASTDEKKQKRPYQLFGEWLKENDETYKALSFAEFSQTQAQLWKGAEGAEWKAANNYVESASKKSKKSIVPTEQSDSSSDKPKAKSAAVKPAKKVDAKVEPPKKPAAKPAKKVDDDVDSDIEPDVDSDSEVDEE